jgi:hypothetical protein
MWVVLSVLGCEGGGDGTEDTNDGTDTDLPWIDDVIAQTTYEKVDIAWLIDPEWDEGVTHLNEVVQDGAEVLLLADADWTQGVINVSSPASGPNFGLFARRWQSYPPPPNPYTVGQAFEDPKHRGAAYTALDLKAQVPQNEDFVRSDAHLYLIVLGDRVDATPDELITRPAFLDWLDGLPSDSKRLGAIVGIDEVKAYFETLSADVGPGGLVYQVGSFSQAIQDQMRTAINQRSSFPLSQIPSEPPRHVTVDVRNEETEYDLDTDYLYNAVLNEITFLEYVPPVGSQVLVRYLPVGVDTPVFTETGDTATTTTEGE